MLRWVWPILFISYVKFACCIPSFSEIFRWQLWFVFLHVLRPLSFESFAERFSLLTLSFWLTFKFHWLARIRCYDKDLWCIFKLEEFAKEKYGQTPSVANMRGPCVRKLLNGLIMYIYPLKIKNIVLYCIVSKASKTLSNSPNSIWRVIALATKNELYKNNASIREP